MSHNLKKYNKTTYIGLQKACVQKEGEQEGVGRSTFYYRKKEK